MTNIKQKVRDPSGIVSNWDDLIRIVAFRIVSIQNRIHLGLCTFGFVFFGTVSIYDGADSDNCPGTGIKDIRIRQVAVDTDIFANNKTYNHA